MHAYFDPVPWHSLVPDWLCRMRIVTCTRPKLRIQSCIEHSVLQIGNDTVCQILEKCREHSFTYNSLDPSADMLFLQAGMTFLLLALSPQDPAQPVSQHSPLPPSLLGSLVPTTFCSVSTSDSFFLVHLPVFPVRCAQGPCVVLNSSFISCVEHKD